MVEMFELNYFSLNKQTPLDLKPTLTFKYPVAGKLQGFQRESQRTKKTASMTQWSPLIVPEDQNKDINSDKNSLALPQS